MDDEKDRELSFEEQLAELIKQSGGTVPPTHGATEQENKGGEQAAESDSEQPRQKTPEEVEAEIEAKIAGTAAEDGGDDTPRQKTPEEVEAEIEEMIAKSERERNGGFVMPDEGEGAGGFVMPDSGEENTQASGEKADEEDEELAAILAQIDELESDIDEENRRKEQDKTDSESSGGYKRSAADEKLDERLDALISKLDSEDDDTVIEVAPPIVRERPKRKPTPVKSFESVEGDGSVSELEQLRAKVAALEFLLAQKSEEKPKRRERPQDDRPERAERSERAERAERSERAERTEPKAQPQASATGDVTSMFKQWFDLEMAAKMKNIITEDEQRAKGEKPADSVAEVEVPPDMIKIADGVFYNVRDKKTYALRELSPTLPPAQKKPKPKKKTSHSSKRPRRRRRRPGMRGGPRRRRRPL